MKFNIANPQTGQQKKIDIDEEAKLRLFYEKRISDEIALDGLGGNYIGYVVKITGGHDKDGFPMKQGVLLNTRVRLLIKRGTCAFRKWRGRRGERRRKSVRGCIVGPDLSVLNLVIVKKGEKELPGLTDDPKPRSLGPKRASKIRKMFKLTKEDDVRKYVIKHKRMNKKKQTEFMKGPKIQRLVTPARLARKEKVKAIRSARAIKRKNLKKEFEGRLKEYKLKLLEKKNEKKEEVKKDEKKN